jgi:DNA-binding NtrC family response regulator
MVETELGRGSIFTVHLPLAVSGLDGPAAAVPTPRRGTERVLLVEDEEAVRMLAQMILQQAGYRVAAAATPAEAERVFDAARGDFDVLVSDVIMPGGTGPALFTVLRARKPTLKVLYMSGYTDNVTLGDSGSARNFVQKPFAADDLTRRLYEVLHVDGG